MIAYEKLHEKLNQSTKCYLYIIGCDDIDFSNPDSKIWIFEMNQWKKGAIPKNTRDFNEDVQVKQNKFLVYREYMEEISVEKLRQVIDSHWKDFE
jgi:tRNA A37 threonylcarbamoyladenosine dehydratase